MTSSLRLGVLGAGLGSRLSSRAKAKPLAQVGGQSLLAHLIYRFHACVIAEMRCALRDELLSPDEKATLPQKEGVSYLFVNTESSLHTLVELIRSLKEKEGPVLFTMADTVLRKEDLRQFVDFCRKLGPGENAVLVTPHVDDEKPLWVQQDSQGRAISFGSEPAKVVTSGMYLLQPQAMEIAEEVLAEGTEKMRNFLRALTERKQLIKTFVVTKTIDVDHPSDLDQAAQFMQGD